MRKGTYVRIDRFRQHETWEKLRKIKKANRKATRYSCPVTKHISTRTVIGLYHIEKSSTKANHPNETAQDAPRGRSERETCAYNKQRKGRHDKVSWDLQKGFKKVFQISNRTYPQNAENAAKKSSPSFLWSLIIF